LRSELFNEGSADEVLVQNAGRKSVLEEELVELALADLGVEALCCEVIGGNNSPARVDDAGRSGDRPYEIRISGIVPRGGFNDPRAAITLGETEDITVLICIESEGSSNGVEHFKGHASCPSLFEPCVPGDAHAGDHGNFLPTETLSATTDRRRKTDVFGTESCSLQSEELA
jgi:hypothetical protein